MFKYFVKIAVLFLIFLTSLTYAQGKGKIKGTVVDANSGEPLFGANVIIKGTTIGAATDFNGKFLLPPIEAGNYVLKVSYIGYKKKLIKIKVIPNRTTSINVKLEWIAVKSKSVIVTAQAKGQMGAINEQISSNTIKNVVSSDRLREIPDANAAESVGRLPGVAIVRSGGEASKIIIRGLQQGYTTVSLGGVKMPATSDDRGVGIAMISPYMVDGIELTKAITPDMDGDATAGNVEFKIKQAPSGMHAGILLEGGYSGNEKYFGMPKINLDFSNRFFDDKLGVFFQGSFYRADRSTDNLYATYYPKKTPTEKNPFPDIITGSLTVRKNFEIRDRYGVNLVFDYKLPNGKLLFKNFGSRMYSNKYLMENRYVQLFMSPYASGIQDAQTDATVNVLSGEHNILDGLLDWSVSYSYRDTKNPNNWSMSPEPDETNMPIEVLNYANKGASVIPAFYNDFNTDIITLRYLRYNAQHSTAGNFATKINMEIPFKISNSISLKIKFGGKYSQDDRKRDDSANLGWLRNPTSKIAMLKRDYPFLKWNKNDYITMESFVNDIHDTKDVFGGDFQLYFPINIERTKNFVNSFKKYSAELITGRQNNYNNTEKYYAGYLMATVKLTNKLSILPGVRYEKTSDRYYDTYNVKARQLSDADLPIERQGEFWPANSYQVRENWLPMFHIMYNPFKWMKIRTAYTKTLKRPSFKQFSPIEYLNTQYNTFSKGNPNLKVQVAENYDLNISFFGNYIGLLSIGGFYKHIKNMIYSRTFFALTKQEAQSYHSQLLRGAKISTIANVPGYKTWVKGLEFEWQTNFWYLPFPFNGLVLNFNFTLMDSETSLIRVERTKDPVAFPPVFFNKDVEVKQKMPGQNDILANLSIGYDYKDFSIRISSLYQGPTYIPAQYQVSEQVKEELFRWDIKMTQRFTDNIRFSLDFNNITNWRDLTTMRYHGFIVSKEQYGWQGYAGITYRIGD